MGKVIEFTGTQLQSKPGIETLNDGRRCITIATLRAFKGCQHYSDEQGAEIVESIKSLSLILLDMVRDEAIAQQSEDQHDYKNELNQAA